MFTSPHMVCIDGRVGHLELGRSSAKLYSTIAPLYSAMTVWRISRMTYHAGWSFLVRDTNVTYQGLLFGLQSRGWLM